MSAVMDILNGQGDRRSRSLAVWSWLRRALLLEDNPGLHQDAPVVVTAIAVAPMHAAKIATADRAVALRRKPSMRTKDGIVLPFPIHGEALLVKLAEVLRSRIADRCPDWDALLPQLTRRPWSRLSIDRDAYVEFREDRGEFRAVIEPSHGTRVTIETADFDVVVDFVLQYVASRLCESTELEAAS
jgi:hypothetical protein